MVIFTFIFIHWYTTIKLISINRQVSMFSVVDSIYTLLFIIVDFSICHVVCTQVNRSNCNKIVCKAQHFSKILSNRKSKNITPISRLQFFPQWNCCYWLWRICSLIHSAITFMITVVTISIVTLIVTLTIVVFVTVFVICLFNWFTVFIIRNFTITVNIIYRVKIMIIIIILLPLLSLLIL